MNAVEAVVAWVLIWWTVLFMVLPFGVRPNRAAGASGHDPGAPENPRLRRKLLLTTVFATLLFGLLYAVVKSGAVSLRALVGAP